MRLYTVFKWFEGEEKSLEIFTTPLEASTKALEYAQELWLHHVEDDWPMQPETWQEIYQETLNRAGNIGDEIEIYEHDLIPHTYAVGTTRSDEALLMPDPDNYIEDQIADGYDPEEFILYEAWPRDFTCEVERVVRVVVSI